MVFDKKQLTQYLLAKFTGKLVPLHQWDAIDQHGRERGKSPRDGAWRDRRYTKDQLQTAMDNGHNLGVRLGPDDLVVDMDPRNMTMTCDEAVDMLDTEFGTDLANSPTVVTGSGGYHIYTSLDDGWAGTKFRNGLDGYPGVEFKAHGKQVVAAGSKHPNGTTYVWKDNGVTLDNGDRGMNSNLLVAIAKTAARKNENAATDVAPEKLGEMLSHLDPTDFSDNDSWVQLAMSCFHATAGLGVDQFVEWSLSDPNYSGDEEIIRMRWDSFEGGEGVTSATLFKFVSEAGMAKLLKPEAREAFGDSAITEADAALLANVPDLSDEPLFERDGKGKAMKTAANTKRGLRGLGVSAVRNAFTETNFVVGRPGGLNQYHALLKDGEFNKVDDDVLTATRNAIMARWGFEPSMTTVMEAYAEEALQHSFHPVQDYLNTLTWDGEDRISDFFTKFCGTDPGPLATRIAQIMFKAAVARAFKPGVKFDTMVILEGKQGCGKSTLIRYLAGPGWSVEGLPPKLDKDTVQALQGSWLVEIEELNMMRKSDIDAMKGFVSKTEDTARFAYAKTMKTYPRKCILIGTTNDDQYLLDSTGNRRYLPIRVGTVDLLGVRAARDQLWAQATQMWKDNPTEDALMLPQNMWNEAAEEQDHRRVQDPIEYDTTEYLARLDSDIDFVSSQTLMWEIIKKASSDANLKDTRRINRAMKTQTGWEPARRTINDVKVRGYERSAT